MNVPSALWPPTRWHGPHSAPHRPRWSTAAAVLAVLAMAGLLVAFGQVVRKAVRQSEMRHLAVLAHASATWQCKALRSRRERADCLQQMAPWPTQMAALRDIDHPAVPTAHGDADPP